jgi:FkbM family methyltransferase
MQAFFFKEFINSYIPQILEEIYIKKIYEPFLFGKKDLIIADWGGNIGLTSYYFKDYAKIVYCVEPAKQHIECINELIRFNNIKNIKICPYAISNENKKMKFYHNDNVTMFSLNEAVNQKNDYEDVDTIAPDEFFNREGINYIDLLKFDTEGFEGQIISSDGFRAIADKIKVIIGEHHSWASMNQQQFELTFKDLGFDFNWIKGTSAAVFTAIKL